MVMHTGWNPSHMQHGQRNEPCLEEDKKSIAHETIYSSEQDWQQHCLCSASFLSCLWSYTVQACIPESSVKIYHQLQHDN